MLLYNANAASYHFFAAPPRGETGENKVRRRIGQGIEGLRPWRWGYGVKAMALRIGEKAWNEPLKLDSLQIQ